MPPPVRVALFWSKRQSSTIEGSTSEGRLFANPTPPPDAPALFFVKVVRRIVARES